MPEKQSRHIIDHYELLIRLDENMKSVLNELKEMREHSDGEMKEMREQHSTEMKGILTRIMSVETFMAENSLIKKVQIWDETAQYVTDFRKSWKLLVTILGIASGAVSWFVANLYQTVINR